MSKTVPVRELRTHLAEPAAGEVVPLDEVRTQHVARDRS